MTSFPDVRWGSDRSPLRRPMLWFSKTQVGSWTVRTLTPLDRWLLHRTGGRYTVLGPFGAPIMLLTTTGARSGLPRTTPLLYARADDALIVAGSNFGQAHHPAWTENLLKHPAAVVTIGGIDVPVVAEPLEGAEAHAAFERMVQIADTYAAYRSRTTRRIRVFRLRRAAT